MRAAILCACVIALGISSLAMARDPIGIPGPPDQSLWWRYYGAGAAAMKKNDADSARKYWFASLSELEKFLPHAKHDMWLAVKMSALEEGLTEMYPEDWSKEKGTEAEQLKRRQEQVGVLYRIAQINRRYVQPNDLLASKSAERYSKARDELKQAQDEAARKKAGGQPTASASGAATGRADAPVETHNGQ